MLSDLSTALTIKGIKARAVSVPLTRPITTAFAVIPSAPLVLIDVETDQGIVGRSYIFGYSPITLRPLVELIANLTEMLRGKSVSPVERMRDFENGFRLLGRQGLLGMAISGLDMAFWDVLARAKDQSVARLLGGEDNVAESINHLVQKHNFKLLHVGQESSLDSDGNPWQSTVAMLGHD